MVSPILNLARGSIVFMVSQLSEVILFAFIYWALEAYDPGKNYNGISNEDSPGGGNVIIHHVPEESKSRWSHIEDLDSFFKKVYEYHQRHGFTVMMLQV